MSKPGDYFIGVIGFFGTLLPGAAGVALLDRYAGGSAIGVELGKLSDGDAVAWTVFLVAAYIFGNLFHAVGALLDPLAERFRRLLMPWVFKGNESAFRSVRDLQAKILDANELESVNAYQWSRAILTARSPEAASDVYALEADSKLFRSLCVLFLVAGCVLMRAEVNQGVLVALILAAGSFARYLERRVKANTQAYIYVISLHRMGVFGTPGR